MFPRSTVSVAHYALWYCSYSHYPTSSHWQVGRTCNRVTVRFRIAIAGSRSSEKVKHTLFHGLDSTGAKEIKETFEFRVGWSKLVTFFTSAKHNNTHCSRFLYASYYIKQRNNQSIISLKIAKNPNKKLTIKVIDPGQGEVIPYGVRYTLVGVSFMSVVNPASFPSFPGAR